MAKYTTVYDKDRDYQAMINDAVANGDYESAAVYEQQRNAKISGEGITDYNQTYDWEKYLPKSGDNTGYINGQDREYDKYTKQANDFDALLDGLQKRMQNREPFSYDPESDPLYAVYRDLYTKNGQNAMLDTLAQISARTGGLASSYAGQAAQGTYNRYMDQLNAEVPELRNLAYEMYRDQIGDDENMFGMLSGRQGRADNLGQNAWDNSYRERAMRYDVEQQAQKDAREEIDAYLAAGGDVENIPADLKNKAGYSDAYLAAMESAYAQKNAGKPAGGGTQAAEDAAGLSDSDFGALRNTIRTIAQTDPAQAAAIFQSNFGKLSREQQRLIGSDVAGNLGMDLNTVWSGLTPELIGFYGDQNTAQEVSLPKGFADVNTKANAQTYLNENGYGTGSDILSEEEFNSWKNKTPLSSREFNSSSQMQRQYGTYDEYKAEINRYKQFPDYYSYLQAVISAKVNGAY